MKKYLKNPYILGILLVLFNNIVSPLIDLILRRFNIYYSSGLIVTLLGVVIVGELYTKIFRQIISNIDRWKIAITYTVINLPLTLIGFYINPNLTNKVFAMIISFFSFGIALLAIYWLLGFSNKEYFKKLNKKY